MKNTVLGYRLLVVGLSIFVPALALAAEKEALPTPDPGNVTLTLEEFNRLTELASKPPKPPDLPPLAYSLKRAALKLKAGDDSALGSVQLDGEVLKKGTIKVPLIAGVTVFDSNREGKAVPLQLADGVQTAVLSGPNDFSIQIDAGIPLRIEPGRASLSLNAPAAGSVTLSLVVPGEHTVVGVNPGLITSRTSEGGHTAVEATLVPGQPATIWWATRELPTPMAPREVRFLSELKTLVSVSEADLSIATLADVTVVQGEPAQFEVEIPTGYEITGVTGSSLDSTETQSGILILKVNSPSQKNHEFLISMERPLSATKADAPFMGFRNAQRETGEVLVEGAGSMEITGTEGGSLKRMDVKEANGYLRSLAHYPPQAAFRYHRQITEPPTLALEWTRFPDSSVLAAVAEDATITTLVTSEGKSLTEVRLTVKNQAQPFLKVALPQGASILSADVGGEKVKPVEGPDGNRVPLLRPGFRPNGVYEVSFVFMHSGAPFAKKGGSELVLPGMDIPVDLLNWEVFLPDRYKVKDFGGDVMAAELVPTAFVEGGGGVVVARDITTLNAPTFVFNAAVPRMLLAGQIGGTVLDPSGAVIPNAHVTIISPETGLKRDAYTDVHGNWVTYGFASGQLQFRVDSNGFKSTAQNLFYDSNRPQSMNSVLQVGAATETVEVSAGAMTDYDDGRERREAKKQAQQAQSMPSENVLNLQKRVAGVLPIAVDVPHAGTAFHFVRPLVVNEETKVTFTYKSRG
jgi:Carboxypeptidase regulatory-like domain